MRRIGVALLVVVALGTHLAVAAEPSVWDRVFDAATGVRFTPVELWTGAEWTLTSLSACPGNPITPAGEDHVPVCRRKRADGGERGHESTMAGAGGSCPRRGTADAAGL